MNEILLNKYYDEQSVFLPENLLREARRQKKLKECNVPPVCLLDPDGDLVAYLLKSDKASKNECWACYHSSLYTFELEGRTIGIIPCIVGSSYAVLVAEQLFVSGCRLLISVTSAGIISQPNNSKRFALITNAIRDEGTSYHYLPPDKPSVLNNEMLQKLYPSLQQSECPFFEAGSWTTDAPYRETQTAINTMKEKILFVWRWRRQQFTLCQQLKITTSFVLRILPIQWHKLKEILRKVKNSEALILYL